MRSAPLLPSTARRSRLFLLGGRLVAQPVGLGKHGAAAPAVPCFVAVVVDLVWLK